MLNFKSSAAGSGTAKTYAQVLARLLRDALHRLIPAPPLVQTAPQYHLDCLTNITYTVQLYIGIYQYI